MEALDTHSIRQKQKAETVNSVEDDDRLFLLSLVPFLKLIPPHFKFAARLDIMQSINKFIAVQPPAPSQHSQQLAYNRTPTQAHYHQSGINGNIQIRNLNLPDFLTLNQLLRFSNKSPKLGLLGFSSTVLNPL